MMCSKNWALAACLGTVLVIASCGGDDGGTDTIQSTDTIQPTDTMQPTDKGGTTDTGTAGHKHGAWGVAWEDFWPDTSKTAVYSVTPLGGGDSEDWTARWKENVDWKGGTWLAIEIGDPQPGKDGLTAYIDRTEPWVAKFKGASVFSKDFANGPMLEEWWDNPLTLDFDIAVGQKANVAAPQHTSFDGGAPDTADMTYEVTLEKVDGSVTVPAGTYDNCLVLNAKIGGPFTVEASIWFHAEQFGLKIDDSPLGASMILKEGWK